MVEDKIREIMRTYWLQETETGTEGINEEFQETLVAWNKDYGDIFVQELAVLFEWEIDRLKQELESRHEHWLKLMVEKNNKIIELSAQLARQNELIIKKAKGG
jgi:transketolase